MNPLAQRTAAPLTSTPEGLRTQVQEKIASIREKIREISSVSGSWTLENTLRPYDAIHADYQSIMMWSWFAQDMHPDASMRAAGGEALQSLVEIENEFLMDRQLFEAVQAVEPTSLNQDALRLRKFLLRDFRQAGVHLDAATREQLTELAKREMELVTQFQGNIARDVRVLRIDRDRLAGLSEDFFRNHPTDDQGKVALYPPDLQSVLGFVIDPQVRKDYFLEMSNGAWPQNEPVLLEMLAVRREKARLLGFENWVECASESSMAASGKRIEEFLGHVEATLQGPLQATSQQILALKRQEHPEATAVEVWEQGYYTQQLLKSEYGFDTRELLPYLGLERCLQGVLDLTAQLYGLEYHVQVEATRWHEDVRVFDVSLDGRPIARLYLDLHPREGKQPVGRVMPLNLGIPGQQLAEVGLFCNFPKGLLTPQHLGTLFHEFGHLTHVLLGNQQSWARLWGLGCEIDFLEVPSMFFEEWCKEHRILSRFARHCDTDAPIPEELLRNWKRTSAQDHIQRVRSILRGAAVSLNLYLADPRGLDTTAVWADAQNRYGGAPYQKGSHWQASFAHLATYTSNYYTYLWSQVIALDLLDTFSRHDLLDPELGRRYRDTILARGATEDAENMIRDFLGRDFDFQPFRAALEG